MKKYLFFITKLGHGGAERVATNVANKYAEERENDVRVILTYDNESAYTLNESITTCVLPFSNNHFLRIVKRFVYIHKYIKKEAPDIVVSIPEGTSWYIALDSLLQKKYKMVLSQRADPKVEYPNRLKRRIINWIFSRSDKVVFQTKEQMSFFDENVQKKGSIILNPIIEHLPKRKTDNLKHSIFTFCRLCEEKNLNLLIDGFAEITNKYSDFTLDIWGKGPLEDELKERVKSMGLSDKIIFHGYSSNIHEDICDSYMFISTSNHEGLSNAMLETMAMGFPVICTDCPCGGARMVINDHVNGLLIPVEDTRALVNAMIEIIEDSALREKISLNAEKIKSDLSSDKIFSQWKSVIE